MGIVHRRTTDGWEGVTPQPYGDAALAGVLKYELITPGDGAQGYEMRHFSVPPGGRTARERHSHDHGVMIVSGRARVTLGEKVHELGPGDVVHVGSDELHCFEALGDEPLGFLCVVPARR